MADFDITMKMEGLDALVAKIQSVKYDMARKGGRFALRKAAQVIRDQARQTATALNDPKTAEMIAKNITEKWNGRLNKATGDLGFRVGVLGGARSSSADAARSARRRRASGVSSLESLGEMAGAGAGNPGGDTFYWRFLEFGTEKMAARPFMRPAIQAGQKSVDVFVAEYGKALDRALKRQAKG